MWPEVLNLVGVHVKPLLHLRLFTSGLPSLAQPAARPPSVFLAGSQHTVRRALGQALPWDSPTDVVDGTIGLLLLWGQSCPLRDQAVQNPGHIGLPANGGISAWVGQA